MGADLVAVAFEGVEDFMEEAVSEVGDFTVEGGFRPEDFMVGADTQAGDFALLRFPDLRCRNTCPLRSIDLREDLVVVQRSIAPTQCIFPERGEVGFRLAIARRFILAEESPDRT
jgi:hypothetical protein